MKKTLTLNQISVLLVFLCSSFTFSYGASYQSLFEPFASMDNWTTVNSSTSTLSNGHLNVAMVLQSNSKYRADIHFNDAASTSISLNLNPSVDGYLAVKFIGTRPSGSLKMEMQNTSGTWFNTKWNSGSPDGSITTTAGNTIYYFQLTKDANYIGTSIDFRKVNIIIADSPTTSSYVIDWIATFASVTDITDNKDFQDDGTSDNDDVTSTGITYGKNSAAACALSSPSGIKVCGAPSESQILVYNTQGIKVAQAVAQDDVVELPVSGKGLFIVNVIAHGVVTSLKVIK